MSAQKTRLCAVEHLWLPQRKRRRLWLCQIIAPYHKSSSNRSDKEKHCYFHSTDQSNYSTLPEPPDTFGAILFCRITVPAVSSTRVRTVLFSCLGLENKSLAGFSAHCGEPNCALRYTHYGEELTALTVKGSATFRLNPLQTKASQPRREK